MNGQLMWSPGMTIDSMKKEFVANALRFYNGNDASAANSLGITVVELKGILAASQFDAEAQAAADKKHTEERLTFLARSRGLVYRDPETQMDTVMPFPAGQAPAQPAEGLDGTSAAEILAGRSVTPENAIPLVAVLPNAGDPVSAAAKTATMMKETFPQD
jgi:hypothetical protein